MIYKFISILFTFWIRLRYFNRIKLSGIIILDEGFAKISIDKGAKLIIKGNVSLRKNTQILIRENAICIIGKGSFFNRNCSIVCRKNIEIGEDCLFGEDVKIYDNDHLVDANKIYKKKFKTSKVLIGKNVWVGNNVNILKQSIIYSNSIIGAMSLVTSDLKEPGVFVGIPAKRIKSR
jgi:acetyltransferase-like isoleucine patch superfamily enzyme